MSLDIGDSRSPLSMRGLRTSFRVLRNRNFRLLWISTSIAMMGDSFMFVAMPFLVMNLTDSRSALGGIMAVGGIPRAMFILFGGVFSDRFPPLPIIKLSRLIFCILLAGMSALILSHNVHLWMLYAFSCVMGIVGAFGMPASMAILPRLVGYDQLPAANALTGGTSQLIMAVAPAVAGVIVPYLSREPLSAILRGEWPAILPKRADLQGIGLAYGIDAFGVFLSMFALWAILMDRTDSDDVPGPHARPGVFASIGRGFAYAWEDASLRAFIIYMAVTTFVAMGPNMVAMPVLADERLGGISSYGVMMGASGVGAVLGSLLAGVFTPSNRALGSIMIAFAILRGLGTGMFAYTVATTQAAVIMGFLGLVMGYTSILFMTWIQRRVQISFLGRVMSLVMLSAMGLQPLSQAFTGWFIDVSGLTLLFLGIGIFMVVSGALAFLSKGIRQMGEPPVGGADRSLTEDQRRNTE